MEVTKDDEWFNPDVDLVGAMLEGGFEFEERRQKCREMEVFYVVKR